MGLLGAVGRRLVYDFDGIDDLIGFTSQTMNPGDILKTVVITPPSNDGAFRRLFSGTLGQFLWKRTNGRWGLTNGTLLVDGVPTLDSDLIPFDGQAHTIEWTCTDAVDFDTLGNGWLGVIYDFDLNGVLHPINDGWAANPVIAPDGTAFNFNQERWIYVQIP